jgi:hypothetical protein
VEESTERAKIMAFQEKYLIRSKIRVCSRTIEQASCFNYLEFYVTYEIEKHIAEKKLQTLTEHWDH